MTHRKDLVRRSASLLVLALGCSGCSLLVNPRGDYDYTGVDGGIDASTTALDAASDSGLADAHISVDGGREPLDPPLLRFPWNGYGTGSALTGALTPPLNALRPRFMWEPVAGATAYEIELSSECEAGTRQSCPFSDVATHTASSTEWIPPTSIEVGMTAPVGRRYFWRVRACVSTDACSAWSEVRFVDVGRMTGDFDGDGHADLVVGAPSASPDGVSQAGQLVKYSGPNLDTPVRVLAPTPTASARFGSALTHAGDVNGDGFPDLVVGDGAASTHGALLPGASFGVSSSAGTSLDDEGLEWGEMTVAGGGDLNADGFSDFAMASMRRDERRGAVHVYLGGPDGASAIADLVITSPNAQMSGHFGRDLSLAGDINGDGFADLVVGASNEDGRATSGSGRVYVFWGTRDGVDTAAPVELTSPDPVMLGSFGSGVYLHDLNADGFADVLVTAPERHPDGGTGRLYLFLGARDFVGVSEPRLDSPEILTADYNFSAVGAADIDADGTAEVLTNLSFQPFSGTPRATYSTYRWTGTTGWLETSTSPFEPSPDPGSITPASTIIGDVNGDGRSEAAIGVSAVSTVFVAEWDEATERLATLRQVENTAVAFFGSRIAGRE